MSNETVPDIGRIIWTDLTVPDAGKIKDFYRVVVGWEAEPVTMGDYEDFNLKVPGTEDAVAGVCHARGSNADLPPAWLVYIIVRDVDESAERCVGLGGEILVRPRGMGEHGRYCVIRDPAGAVAALFTPNR